MLVDNKNFREAAHIGEEIFNDADLAMRSKCISVHDTVTDGTFTLNKALSLYQVPYDTYIAFVARKQAEEIEDQSKSASKKHELIFKVDVFQKMLRYQPFLSLDKNSIDIIADILNKYSKDLIEEKVLLK